MQELLLYFTPATVAHIEAIAAMTTSVFPEMKVLEKGELLPASSAFDPARNQYDAAYLLPQIPPHEGLNLWVIAEDIFVPGKLRIFGTAGGPRAVMSTFMLETTRAVCNVAVHEICHMLGLAHCPGPCLMRQVRSSKEAEKRPFRLCASCEKKFAPLLLEDPA